MKKFFIIITCLLLTGVTGFSQSRKAPVKSVPKESVTTPAAPVKEIPADEWAQITNSIESESWDKAVTLSANALKKLTAENEQKQLASLRYFYLFSLAGKVQAKTTTFAEFERISQAFIGKDFLMPSRQVSANCSERVNYICEVSNDVMTLRVTATNKTGTAIHFFEYYALDEFFDVPDNNRKKAFLSGKLNKVEAENVNNIRIIRLTFEECKVELVKK